MRYLRQHKKVMLWWNNWFAAQLVILPEFSLGIRIEPKRPLLDLFLGPLTLALGSHPILTDERVKHQHRSRGFIYTDEVII